MDIFKIVAVGLITTICAVILKQVKPELSIFVGVAGSLVIVFLILNSLSSVFGEYKSLLDKTGLNNGIFSCVLKVIGVGYLVEFAGGICAEAGVKLVAEKILFAGKILILIMCMPIFKNLIEIIIQLVP